MFHRDYIRWYGLFNMTSPWSSRYDLEIKETYRSNWSIIDHPNTGIELFFVVPLLTADYQSMVFLPNETRKSIRVFSNTSLSESNPAIASVVFFNEWGWSETRVPPIFEPLDWSDSCSSSAVLTVMPDDCKLTLTLNSNQEAKKGTLVLLNTDVSLTKPYTLDQLKHAVPSYRRHEVPYIIVGQDSGLPPLGTYVDKKVYNKHLSLGYQDATGTNPYASPVVDGGDDYLMSEQTIYEVYKAQRKDGTLRRSNMTQEACMRLTPLYKMQSVCQYLNTHSPTFGLRFIENSSGGRLCFEDMLQSPSRLTASETVASSTVQSSQLSVMANSVKLPCFQAEAAWFEYIQPSIQSVLWVPAHCSDDSSSDQSSCSGTGTWVPAACLDPSYTTQTDCEANAFSECRNSDNLRTIGACHAFIDAYKRQWAFRDPLGVLRANTTLEEDAFGTPSDRLARLQPSMRMTFSNDVTSSQLCLEPTGQRDTGLEQPPLPVSTIQNSLRYRCDYNYGMTLQDSVSGGCTSGSSGEFGALCPEILEIQSGFQPIGNSLFGSVIRDANNQYYCQYGSFSPISENNLVSGFWISSTETGDDFLLINDQSDLISDYVGYRCTRQSNDRREFENTFSNSTLQQGQICRGTSVPTPGVEDFDNVTTTVQILADQTTQVQNDTQLGCELEKNNGVNVFTRHFFYLEGNEVKQFPGTELYNVWRQATMLGGPARPVKCIANSGRVALIRPNEATLFTTLQQRQGAPDLSSTPWCQSPRDPNANMVIVDSCGGGERPLLQTSSGSVAFSSAISSEISELHQGLLTSGNLPPSIMASMESLGLVENQWTAGACSDGSSDQSKDCKSTWTAGHCSDRSHTSQDSCEASTEIFCSETELKYNTSSSTGHNACHPWTEGYCSDRTIATKDACTSDSSRTWVDGFCRDRTSQTQAECEDNNPVVCLDNCQILDATTEITVFDHCYNPTTQATTKATCTASGCSCPSGDPITAEFCTNHSYFGPTTVNTYYYQTTYRKAQTLSVTEESHSSQVDCSTYSNSADFQSNTLTLGASRTIEKSVKETVTQNRGLNSSLNNTADHDQDSERTAGTNTKLGFKIPEWGGASTERTNSNSNMQGSSYGFTSSSGIASTQSSILDRSSDSSAEADYRVAVQSDCLSPGSNLIGYVKHKTSCARYGQSTMASLECTNTSRLLDNSSQNDIYVVHTQANDQPYFIKTGSDTYRYNDPVPLIPVEQFLASIMTTYFASEGRVGTLLERQSSEPYVKKILEDILTQIATNVCDKKDPATCVQSIESALYKRDKLVTLKIPDSLVRAFIAAELDNTAIDEEIVATLTEQLQDQQSKLIPALLEFTLEYLNDPKQAGLTIYFDGQPFKINPIVLLGNRTERLTAFYNQDNIESSFLTAFIRSFQMQMKRWMACPVFDLINQLNSNCSSIGSDSCSPSYCQWNQTNNSCMIPVLIDANRLKLKNSEQEPLICNIPIVSSNPMFSNKAALVLTLNYIIDFFEQVTSDEGFEDSDETVFFITEEMLLDWQAFLSKFHSGTELIPSAIVPGTPMDSFLVELVSQIGGPSSVESVLEALEAYRSDLLSRAYGSVTTDSNSFSGLIETDNTPQASDSMTNLYQEIVDWNTFLCHLNESGINSSHFLGEEAPGRCGYQRNEDFDTDTQLTKVKTTGLVGKTSIMNDSFSLIIANTSGSSTPLRSIGFDLRNSTNRDNIIEGSIVDFDRNLIPSLSFCWNDLGNYSRNPYEKMYAQIAFANKVVKGGVFIGRDSSNRARFPVDVLMQEFNFDNMTLLEFFRKNNLSNEDLDESILDSHLISFRK